MYAYEYGLKNYDKKYQPLPNLVVFNDEIIIEDDSEKDPEEQIIDKTQVSINIDYEPTPEQYLYFEVDYKYDNRFKYKKGNKAIDKTIAEEYLIPNGYMEDLGVNNIVEDYGINQNDYQVYKYENRYFAKIVTLAFLEAVYPEFSTEAALTLYKNDFSETINYLDEVTIYSKPKSKLGLKIFELSDVFLAELANNPNISIILFFSNDGAKIDNTYLTVDKIRDNEIVFFLEKNDSYNLFGTVARVLTGVNIKSANLFPDEAIAKLAKILNVNTNKSEIQDIAKDHIEQKSKNNEKGILYFLGKVADFFVGIGSWIVKETFGDGLVAIGDAITGLKLSENRWKYFDEKGKPNDKFSPVFPGLKSFLDSTLNVSKEEEEKREADILSTKDKIQEKYESFMNLIPNERLHNYLKKKLQFIPDIAKKIYQWYTDIKKFVLEYAGVTLLYLNAMFVGILNSLLEAIGGIISMVGMILSLPYHLYKAAKDQQKNVHMSFTFELLENALEGFAKLFSFKNLAALFSFPVKLARLVKTVFENPESVVTKFKEGASFIKTSMDTIGYVVGYAIGFIIEEVLTLILTGGAGNIANALRITANSLKKVLTAPKRAAKYTIKTAKDFRETLVAVFNKIKNFDLEKALDTLLDWIQQLVSTTRKLAQDAFKTFFPDKKDRDLIKKAGLEPTSINAAGDVISFCAIK
jgi:hypothetical protein